MIRYKCNLKALLTLGMSHPELYGVVINKLRKNIKHNHFQTLFAKRIGSFIKKDHGSLSFQRAACLDVNSLKVDNLTLLPFSIVRRQEGLSTL